MTVVRDEEVVWSCCARALETNKAKHTPRLIPIGIAFNGSISDSGTYPC